MYILGISAYYHDSAAVLLKDGHILSAVEEERFTRVKHDNSFPYKAIDYVMKANGIKMSDISHIAYYEKPLLKLERILSTFVKTYPKSLKFFVDSVPEILGTKLRIEETLRKNLKFKGKLFFVPHHLSHAACSYLTSDFKEAAILTIDGVGDDSTTEIWEGKGSQIKNLGRIEFPHSIGLMYSTFTAFLGFRVNHDEFKVMGLAAYGKPVYRTKVEALIKSFKDSSFELDLSYFGFTYKSKMWSNKFEQVFGRPRDPKEKIVQRHRDLAASLQEVTEDLYMNVLKHLHSITALKTLCIGGGVGLNSLANGKIYGRTPFKKVHIFGPAGDGGGAMGAALYLYSSILGKKRSGKVETLYFGSSYEDAVIKVSLDKEKLKAFYLKSSQEKINKAVNLLSKGKIVGWFQGRMEFGPRALGNRSIIANPKNRSMKDKVNTIKRREDFRPFAGSVRVENSHELFELPEHKHYSPYMNFCFNTTKEWKSKLGAIVHNDGTTRIQTVGKENGLYYELITAFYKKTGIPCVLNTSFNLSHEPIVESPDQAIWDFKNSPMDALIIGNFLIKK